MNFRKRLEGQGLGKCLWTSTGKHHWSFADPSSTQPAQCRQVGAKSVLSFNLPKTVCPILVIDYLRPHSTNSLS